VPVAVAAFLVGGLALMGVVPSGAYLAKKLLLASADVSGQWWWTLVLQGGAVFTAAYEVLIALRVLRRSAAPLRDLKPVSMLSQCAALGLALASLALALAAVWGPLPAELIGNPLSAKELGNTLAMFVLGALLAAGLARRPLLGPGTGARGGVALLGLAFENGDRFVRRWPSAMLALLLIAGAFGWLMTRG
jgi:NADH:ubiquinone oxidoreductase subunit 5 (subunit L)/multisubunit Na+/H+ antiporter MnhA subunit